MLQCGLDQRPQLVAVGVTSGLQLRVDQFVVDLDLKGPAAGRNQFPGCDFRFELFDQVSRDTHDSRGVVSSSTVFDRDFRHGRILPFYFVLTGG